MTTIPKNHVKLLFWRRTDRDDRHTASDLGSVIISARGCISEAKRLDTYGDLDLGARAGHGITIIWPSGRRREVRAN